MPDLIRVLMVDDHAIVRRGMRAYLATQSDIELVGEAESGEQAARMVQDLAPDVAFVDLLMPGIDGVETTRRIKEVSPTTQVIILTSHHRDEHVFPAIRAGALSYLLKEVGPEELVLAVRRAARGEAMLDPRVAARVVEEVRGALGERPGVFDLTEREMEVLRLIAEAHDNRRIAAGLGISEKTVKRHVSNILGKLHLADRTEAAVYAWRQGVVGRGED